MPVRWTGAASKFLRGPGAESHPNPSLLISRARQVAGGIVNQLALADIWHGRRRVPISERVEVLATVYNNFPGAEPIVELEILVDREVPEEEDFPCLKGFVVDWPTWITGPERTEQPILLVPSEFEIGDTVPDITFKTLVHDIGEDKQDITKTTGSYRRHHPKGLQVGRVDWQGRGKDWVLTWEVTSGHVAGTSQILSANRAESSPASGAVVFCGKAKAILPAGWGVLGAAVEKRDGTDYLNIIGRTVSNGDVVVAFLTRPWTGGTGVTIELLSSEVVPFGMDTSQPFFFNDSGSEAVGMTKRHIVANQTSVADSWRKPFGGDQQAFISSLFSEVTLTSGGSINFETKKLNSYAIMPDPDDQVNFVVERAPSADAATDYPSDATLPPATKVVMAVDWKGDAKTRCTLSVLEAASVLEYTWAETTSTAIPRTDSGSFSGSAQDILIEFENSTLNSFYAFELLSNIGDYSLSFDEEGVVTDGTGSNATNTRHKAIAFLDLRYDFLVYAETNMSSNLLRSSLNSVTPSRTIDLAWKINQGATEIATENEPTFEQSLWQGKPAGTSDSFRPVDVEYVPDMWLATLVFFGAPIGLFYNGLFQDWRYSIDDDGANYYQGFMRFPSPNIFALATVGLPFVDWVSNMASYGGKITAYLHNTGQRIHDVLDQDWTQATHNGQRISISGMRIVDSQVPLNTHIGIIEAAPPSPDETLGFRYQTTDGVELPEFISFLSLL